MGGEEEGKRKKKPGLQLPSGGHLEGKKNPGGRGGEEGKERTTVHWSSIPNQLPISCPAGETGKERKKESREKKGKERK